MTSKNSLKIIQNHVLSLGVMFFFLVLSTLPLWRTLNIFPNFFLLIYFHWLLYRSDLVTLPHIILISIIRDGIFNHLMGASLIQFLMIYVLILNQRRLLLTHGFPVVYTAFLITSIVDAAIFWGLLSYENNQWVEPKPLFLGVILLFFLYPLASLLSRYIQRLFFK